VVVPAGGVDVLLGIGLAGEGLEDNSVSSGLLESEGKRKKKKKEKKGKKRKSKIVPENQIETEKRKMIQA